jgi:ring-1,2-phenylacetyl-CoA epoxidase subunit PaaA
MFTDKVGPKDLALLPPEYRELLVKILTIHADGEIAAPQMYLNEWCLKAATAFDQMMIAQISAQEIDHYRKVANILQQIDVDVSYILKRTPEDRDISAINRRPATWQDLVTFYFLVDRVAFYQLEEFADCSYLPVCQAMPKIIEEEKTHVAYGAKHVKMLASSPETKPELQRAINEWFPRALDMFGRSKSRRAERYMHWGIKKRTNEELRQAWLDAVTPLLTEYGLQIPDPTVGRTYM